MCNSTRANYFSHSGKHSKNMSSVYTCVCIQWQKPNSQQRSYHLVQTLPPVCLTTRESVSLSVCVSACLMPGSPYINLPISIPCDNRFTFVACQQTCRCKFLKQIYPPTQITAQIDSSPHYHPFTLSVFLLSYFCFFPSDPGVFISSLCYGNGKLYSQISIHNDYNKAPKLDPVCEKLLP